MVPWLAGIRCVTAILPRFARGREFGCKRKGAPCAAQPLPGGHGEDCSGRRRHPGTVVAGADNRVRHGLAHRDFQDRGGGQVRRFGVAVRPSHIVARSRSVAHQPDASRRSSTAMVSCISPARAVIRLIVSPRRLSSSSQGRRSDGTADRDRIRRPRKPAGTTNPYVSPWRNCGARRTAPLTRLMSGSSVVATCGRTRPSAAARPARIQAAGTTRPSAPGPDRVP